MAREEVFVKAEVVVSAPGKGGDREFRVEGGGTQSHGKEEGQHEGGRRGLPRSDRREWAEVAKGRGQGRVSGEGPPTRAAKGSL